MYLQLPGTAIRAKCAPLYACLTVGYLEDKTFHRKKLPKYFNESERRLIMELLKRYMDMVLSFGQ